MRSYLSEIVRPTDIIFDVGANIGQTTHTFLSLGASVIAIELDPDYIQIAQARIAHAQAQPKQTTLF